MIIIQETLVSEDIFEKQFACNLSACKGACCVEGDEGAFVDEKEIKKLKEVYPAVKKYMSKEGIEAVEKQGYYVVNDEGILKTPLMKSGPCAYTIFENGIALCGIEKAYFNKEVKWRKPVSCHLYPIRITRVGDHDALNYERWNICKPACTHGKSLGIPVYQFVRDALVRKYGKEYYKALEATAKYLQEKK
ncbi:MAG: DUF3109 family protein [Chitinophagales bacterium]